MSASFKLNDTEIFSELNQTVTAKNINVAANDLTTPSMCKAWVNFNGTLSMTVGSSYGPNVGNVNPIRAAYNVDYVIDRGVGNYEIHFENAMPDNDYVIVACGRHHNAVSEEGIIVTVQTGDGEANISTSSVLITPMDSSTTHRDSPFVSVAIFR